MKQENCDHATAIYCNKCKTWYSGGNNRTKAEERLIKAVLTHFQCLGGGPTGCGSGICKARDAVRRERKKK